MIVLLLLACAAHGPVDLRPPVQSTDPFLIRARDREMAGLAVVSVTDEAWALQALTPTGVSLFTVRGAGDAMTVDAPDPAMAATLARIPFARDLRLLYRLRCDDRCRADEGRLVADGDTVRWRGRGGPAEVVRSPGRAVLTDGRRGYELVVLGDAASGGFLVGGETGGGHE